MVVRSASVLCGGDGGGVGISVNYWGIGVKQELLEMRSERARVVRLTGLLEEAAELVAFRQVVRERAAGNGHVER